MENEDPLEAAAEAEPRKKKRESPEQRRALREAKKKREELRRAPTVQDITEWLHELRTEAAASGRPNYNAILKAIELLGKTQGVFVDVQKIEVAEKDPAAFLAELDEVILNDSEIRQHIRRRLADIDQRGQSFGSPGDGEDSEAGLLSSTTTSGFFPQGYRQ